MTKYFAFFAFFCALQPAFSAPKPLFLTPLIRKDEIEKAQKLAAVKPFLPNVKSYSGYLTVDERYNSNLFFWFFPKTTDWTKAPLVLWLQGGPGASSLFALFFENGPYDYRGNKLRRRKVSWTNLYNVLYVDSPVGTGFSFTDSSAGYATNQTRVAEHLHEALRQFLLLFPQLQRSKLILSGESYAGKYVPSLAHTIWTKNATKPKINVHGLFVGNPLVNPEDMLPHYSDYLTWHGLLDEHGQATMREREELILSHIYSKHWNEASELLQNTFFKFHAKNATLFAELTGIPNYFHMLKDEYRLDEYVGFVDKSSTKEALHVRDSKFDENGWTVYQKMKADITQSMKPQIGAVLENFPTLFHFGQFDVICPYYVHTKVSENIDWAGNYDYVRAERRPLKWGKYTSGYYKTAQRYTEVMIRNAGHMVSADRPRWVLGLLRKFIDGDFCNSTTHLDISY